MEAPFDRLERQEPGGPGNEGRLSQGGQGLGLAVAEAVLRVRMRSDQWTANRFTSETPASMVESTSEASTLTAPVMSQATNIHRQ
jgi:hypothetical protein